MKHTQNYNLNLPDLSDNFSIHHFNQNMETLDSTITKVQTELNQKITTATASLSATMAENESAFKTQLDIIRYNEYVQFVRDHYQNVAYNALGYFCDIFKNYSNVDSYFPDDGININNSALKMSGSYEVGTLGTGTTRFVTMTAYEHKLLFKIPGNGDNVYKYTNIGLHYSQSSTHGSMTVWALGGGGQQNYSLGLKAGESGVCLCSITPKYSSGHAEVGINIQSGISYDQHVSVAIDGNAGGTYTFNDVTYNGSPVGKYGQRTLQLLTTAYTTKVRTANMPFNTGTLFIRYEAPLGTGIVPKISVNGGIQWHTFVLESTRDTVNSSGAVCKEGKYTVENLPRGTSFKIQLEMSRNALEITPIVYDYCLIYGDE